MKIAVIGAGIIGVTTAYELACDGHEVSVLERHGATAEESSFANAGLVAPDYLAPWFAPGMSTRVFQHLFSRHASVKVELPLSARELAWIWKWLRTCQHGTDPARWAQLRRLALYSRERLHHITANLKLDYERSDGYLMLLRSERDSKLVQPSLQMMRDAGVALKELNPVEARKIEPALNPDTSFFAAIHLPDDEVGNCRQFALLLKNEAQRMGVNFSFDTTVTQVASSGGITLRIEGEDIPRQYDACAMCAGLDSARLLAPLNLKIPLVGVNGYSVSAAIREPLNAPRSAVVDERYKVVITRLGNRVRVAGGTKIGGSPNHKNPSALQTLYKVLHDWYPGAANLSTGVQEWIGASPTLPDGQPMVGASNIAGLWLNVGHGSNGWTLSCGSARLLADLMGGKVPDLDASYFASGTTPDLMSQREWVDTIRA
jgi:D-amino-acid dehydrogenase